MKHCFIIDKFIYLGICRLYRGTMAEPAKLLEGLFDKKRMTLLKLFLDHPELEYGIREAARATRLAPATAYRIIRVLLKLGLVEERKIKKLRLYRSSQSKDVKFLDELLAVKKSAIEEFLDLAKGVPGVETVIQYGKPTKEKATLLVIGETVDSNVIARITGEIKDRYNFSILYMVLSSRQYEQMHAMGLYDGERIILHKS